MIETASPVPKYVRIARSLRSRITEGQFAPGSRLPSQRQLMAEYGVALMTVRQVLGMLHDEGLVRSIQGSGVYVADPAAKKQGKQWTGRAVLLIMWDEATFAHPSALELLVNRYATEALARRGLDCIARPLPPARAADALELTEEADVTIVWGTVARDLVHRLIEQGRRVVVHGFLQEGDCPAGAAHVTVDIANQLIMAVSYLRALGHERITLVNRGGTEYWKQIGQGFRDAMERQGLADQADIFVLPRWEDEYEVITYVQKSSSPPSALIVEGAEGSARIARYLTHAGWPVPDRMSILGLCVSELADPLPCRLTYVGSSAAEGCEELADATAALVSQGYLVRRVIPSRFHPGKTCGPRSPRTGATSPGVADTEETNPI